MTQIGVEGGFSRDHLVNIDHGARFNTAGGPGTYAALASALTLRWLEASHSVDAGSGSAVRVFGDGADSGIKSLLTGAGIDTTWLTDAIAPTLWILTGAAGRRIVSADHIAGHELGSGAIEYATPPSVPTGFTSALDGLLRCAPHSTDIDVDAHTLVAVDPDQSQIAERGWSYLEELAETATLFLPSRVQLSQLHLDPLSAASLIRQRTGRSVVARADSDGSYVLPMTGGIWHIAADPVAPVVDTTGAGDSHAAALVTAFVAGGGRNDLARSAAIASIIAATTVRGWGTTILERTTPAHLGDLDAALSRITITEHYEGTYE